MGAAYGFEIHKALVTELQPDREVAASMNEINKQKRLRDAALMAAEAEKIKVVRQKRQLTLSIFKVRVLHVSAQRSSRASKTLLPVAQMRSCLAKRFPNCFW